MKKTITLSVDANDINALTSVLIDVLDYYSTLNNKKEEMHNLRISAEFSSKISDAFYFPVQSPIVNKIIEEVNEFNLKIKNDGSSEINTGNDN